MPNSSAQIALNHRLLALETSGRAGSVALAEIDSNGEFTLICCLELPPAERSAKSLAPTIQDSLRSASWKSTDLTTIAVTIGPGSFTGLRVGITIAKTMAYALGTNLIGINTLAALAETEVKANSKTNKTIWALLDAQRQERFVAKFSADKPMNGEDASVETLRLHESECFARLTAGDIVVSPLSTAMSKRATDHSLGLAEPIEWRDQQPMADAVARLASQRIMDGHSDDLYQLAPQYHRVSAAEENYDSQQKRRDS